jgi:hypothetical protein
MLLYNNAVATDVINTLMTTPKLLLPLNRKRYNDHRPY